MTALTVLALLIEGPKHGYRLKQEAGTIFGQAALHNNLVYPLLRRFTASGWVTRKTVPGARGQNRQQYALTPLGRRTLLGRVREDRKSTRLNSSHGYISYAVFCLKKKKK